jgi:hypothetical protein
VPITHVSEAPNRELYDSLSAKVNLLGDRPTGLILHAAGETATGTVQIVNVWESRAHADAFARDRLLPVFEAAGTTDRAMTRPRPVIAETFEFEYVA